MTKPAAPALAVRKSPPARDALGITDELIAGLTHLREALSEHPETVADRPDSPEVARVMEAIRGHVEAAIHHGADPADIADRMNAALPHVYDQYGPFFDTTGLIQWLGVTRQALSKRASKRQLLALKTADGHMVYPAWQFDARTRQVPEVLQAVLSVLLPAVATPWTAAIWLRTPDEPGGPDALELIKQGWGDRVLADARHEAARWAQ